MITDVSKDCSFFIFRVKLDLEDEGSVFLWNVSNYLLVEMA